MRSRTSRTTRLALSVTAVALLAALVATPGRWSAAQEDDGVVGDFAVSIGSNDVPKDLANGAVLVGRWHVAFLDDGTYYAERLDIGRVVSGSYEVDGGTLTVTDEEGLVSCSNAAAAQGAQGDVATGTYAFERDEEFLALQEADDPCRSRSVLLGTRDFGQFVACLTNAPDATPVAEATPVDEEEDGGNDQPGSDQPSSDTDGGLFDLLTPTSGQADGEDDEPSADEEAATDEDADDEPADGPTDVDAEIDALLAQMTACWQTQDAGEFLPLLTEEFQGVFLGGDGTPEEQEAELEELMVQPLSWERAGDIDLNRDEDEAQVVVRLSVAGADQFVTYDFVLEDDGWKWNGGE